MWKCFMIADNIGLCHTKRSLRSRVIVIWYDTRWKGYSHWLQYPYTGTVRVPFWHIVPMRVGVPPDRTAVYLECPAVHTALGYPSETKFFRSSFCFPRNCSPHCIANAAYMQPTLHVHCMCMCTPARSGLSYRPSGGTFSGRVAPRSMTPT